MKEMEFISEHSCKILDSSKTISISERYNDGKKRWFWEIDHGNRITCEEIMFCPYCGEMLIVEEDE